MTIVIIIIAVLLVLYYFFKKGHASKDVKQDTNAMIMDAVHNIAKNNNVHYWDGFKSRKPKEAKAIEELCGRDMSKASDKDAFEIVTTLLRWSGNAGVSIEKLKKWFLDNVEVQARGVPLEDNISLLKSEKIKEAQQFHISPDNTICNFMLELLIEHESQKEGKKFYQEIARNSNIFEEETPADVNELKKNNLDIAPDISKLDREENRLYSLANEGTEMFEELITGMSEDRIRLSLAGKIEARILCSTMVMELHSNFKNEIDLDVQADRYFLLLADQTLCDDKESCIKDTISFINSRIEFFKKACQEYNNLKGLDRFIANEALDRIFKLLYIKPLCSSIEELDELRVSSNDLIMFKSLFDKIQKAMSFGKERIQGKISKTDNNIRNMFLEILQNIVPEGKKVTMNEDIAWLISDQTIEMVKSGQIESQIKSILPTSIISNITKLNNIYSAGQINKEHFNDILENTQQEYIQSYKN